MERSARMELYKEKPLGLEKRECKNTPELTSLDRNSQNVCIQFHEAIRSRVARTITSLSEK
jgi:hypothetical protein